ncbi:MAG: hypothetical protein AAGD03_03775 [Bordetella sp.]|nr:hypothetical protein [Pseudomonadota bacterium]
MTPERFADLAQAWGARIARWPAAERDAAEQLLRHTPMLQAVLDREAALDHALDAHRVPAPGSALAAAVESSAPRPNPARVRRPRTAWWPSAGWSGAGVAGLGLAGVAAGALAGALLVSAALDAVGPVRAASAESGWARTAFDPAGAPAEGIDE